MLKKAVFEDGDLCKFIVIKGWGVWRDLEFKKFIEQI